MFEILTYERIPFPVQAVEVTEKNFTELAQWTKGVIHVVPSPDKRERKFIKIDAVQNAQNDKQTRAYIGDVILYAEKGGFKIYTKKAFERSFRRLENVQPTQIVLVASVEEIKDALSTFKNNHNHELNAECTEGCPVWVARAAVAKIDKEEAVAEGDVISVLEEEKSITAGNILPGVIDGDKISPEAIKASAVSTAVIPRENIRGEL